MSKKKAHEPDRAVKGLAASTSKMVEVKFEFFREFVGEITLAVPMKTSKDDLVEILAEIQSEHTLDDFSRDNEYYVDDSLSVVECNPVDGDKADANFVATRDGDDWIVEEADAQ